MSETQVLGVSVDSPAANAEFAKQIGVTFPLLSDMTRKVSKEYGILNEEMQFANRTTFVVDKQGVDRKSTRLNSSHLVISYAVFCLKKKKHKILRHTSLLEIL